MRRGSFVDAKHEFDIKFKLFSSETSAGRSHQVFFGQYILIIIKQSSYPKYASRVDKS